MGFLDSEIKKLVKKGKYGELVKRHLKGEVVVPEITNLLEDVDRRVRGNAAEALGRMGEKNNMLCPNRKSGILKGQC